MRQKTENGIFGINVLRGFRKVITGRVFGGKKLTTFNANPPRRKKIRYWTLLIQWILVWNWILIWTVLVLVCDVSCVLCPPPPPPCTAVILRTTSFSMLHDEGSDISYGHVSNDPVLMLLQVVTALMMSLLKLLLMLMLMMTLCMRNLLGLVMRNRRMQFQRNQKLQQGTRLRNV